jgi:hypothetical protein
LAFFLVRERSGFCREIRRTLRSIVKNRVSGLLFKLNGNLGCDCVFSANTFQPLTLVSCPTFGQGSNDIISRGCTTWFFYCPSVLQLLPGRKTTFSLVTATLAPARYIPSKHWGDGTSISTFLCSLFWAVGEGLVVQNHRQLLNN